MVNDHIPVVQTAYQAFDKQSCARQKFCKRGWINIDNFPICRLASKKVTFEAQNMQLTLCYIFVTY